MEDPLLWLWIAIGAIVVVVLVLVVWTASAAASMRRLAETVDARWSALAETLDRRRDVADPLLSTADEGQRRTAADAFGRLESARLPGEKAEAEAAVQRALRPLVQAAGSQPTGSAAADARAALAALDDEAQARRRDYNTGARELNAKGRRFPTSLFKGSAGVPREFFEVDQAGAVAEPPRIQF
ncbi:LemA family protein [Agrococcus sp. SCSIO52902]|uniref:LemA family protein n=1 Tax=Agrococcus sp. SCSIO52902 TaxID=2933290 RepID=UPI001FF1B82D|nr:LemA family protein [Agrococcus sp. SCSIO52902]UOW01119.1 LemA family protein [Agrococcus sp. SCSIO52902]